MEALALDPGEYRGTYKLVGGRLSLDFVNTVSWAGTVRQHDWFDSVDNVCQPAILIAPNSLLSPLCEQRSRPCCDRLRTTSGPQRTRSID